MAYFLYRLSQEQFTSLKEFSALEIDYLPEHIEDGDHVVVFVAGLLKILGPYVKEGKALWAKEAVNVEELKDLRPLYEGLSFIDHIGPRTYKLFAKKVREITEEDYALLTSRE